MMKQMKFTALLFLFSTLLFVQPTYAMFETNNTTTTATVEKQKSALKKEFKAEKRMVKLEKLLKKAGIDLNDPVEKFMWFWIFGWGGALLLQSLYWAGVFSFYWLSGILWAAGTVCLVLWLVKKFS